MFLFFFPLLPLLLLPLPASYYLAVLVISLLVWLWVRFAATFLESLDDSSGFSKITSLFQMNENWDTKNRTFQNFSKDHLRYIHPPIACLSRNEFWPNNFFRGWDTELSSLWREKPHNGSFESPPASLLYSNIQLLPFSNLYIVYSHAYQNVLLVPDEGD